MSDIKGSLKLDSGETVKIDKALQTKISSVLKDLNADNRNKMLITMKRDKKSFDEIIAFIKTVG